MKLNKRTIRLAPCAILALGFSCSVLAADDPARPRPQPIGATTEAVFKMQRDGSAAGQLHPMSGEVAARAYKRYLESFKDPIPETSQPLGSAVKTTATVSR